MAKLTTAQRNKLELKDFAVPGKRKLPIHDKGHVKAAWDLLPRTQGLTTEEIAEARKRILARAKEFDMDTSKWSKISKESIALESLDDLTPRQRTIRGLLLS